MFAAPPRKNGIIFSIFLFFGFASFTARRKGGEKRRLLVILSGMCLLINLLEFFEGGVRVDLRGGHAFMAEEVFDGFEVGAVVEHHGGESVAEDMRGALALRCDEAETAFDGFPYLR